MTLTNSYTQGDFFYCSNSKLSDTILQLRADLRLQGRFLISYFEISYKGGY